MRDDEIYRDNQKSQINSYAYRSIRLEQALLLLHCEVFRFVLVSGPKIAAVDARLASTIRIETQRSWFAEGSPYPTCLYWASLMKKPIKDMEMITNANPHTNRMNFSWSCVSIPSHVKNPAVWTYLLGSIEEERLRWPFG